jgi:hypothetical protein
MGVHDLIYVGLALAYCEAAFVSFMRGQPHEAVRELIFACCYACFAGLAILELYLPTITDA